jgi:hypothetical protein
MTEIRINVFRDGSVWFGARWIDGEYDGCDALGIVNESTEDEAMAAARAMPLTVVGTRDVRFVDGIDTWRDKRRAVIVAALRDAALFMEEQDLDSPIGDWDSEAWAIARLPALGWDLYRTTLRDAIAAGRKALDA